jgi:hypothetical protein
MFLFALERVLLKLLGRGVFSSSYALYRIESSIEREQGCLSQP